MASSTREGAQKPLKPAQEQAEVVACSCEPGIDSVAVASFDPTLTYGVVMAAIAFVDVDAAGLDPSALPAR